MEKNLTRGSIASGMLAFAWPMILGNLLQQLYSIADMLIVGRYLGSSAMAAVGSSYTLMTFLTSILIGLCMGSGTVFSMYYGRQNPNQVRVSAGIAFTLIGAVTVILNILAFAAMEGILVFLHIPDALKDMTRDYVSVIFCGMTFVFLYNFFAYLSRAVGDSVTPLCFLALSSVLNVALDLLFVLVLHQGIRGAAQATVISQILSGLGIALYVLAKRPLLRFIPAGPKALRNRRAAKEILRFSFASSIQQSVMNFGILMIQGLVNSFGIRVMAAFTAAVKVDSFAYMPAQEFGSAFSLFISQNHGAGEAQRIQLGTRRAMLIVLAFCGSVSLLIFLFADTLMLLFVSAEETEIIRIGAQYLRIEGACYCGIGMLFLLYGYFRGIAKPEMSLILTIISLGSRVLLAYVLSPLPALGVLGIWWSIPIGWALADITGLVCMRHLK